MPSGVAKKREFGMMVGAGGSPALWVFAASFFEKTRMLSWYLLD